MILQWGDFLHSPSPQGHLAMSGEIFGCPSQGKNVTSIWGVEARNMAKHPTVPQEAPTGRTISFQMPTVTRLRTLA